MEQKKYQQLYNLKGKFESYIQKSLISSKEELDNSKKEIEKLELELKQYKEKSKEYGTEDTYIYEVKTGELEERIYELEERIYELENDFSINVSFEDFCNYLSTSLKIPAESIEFNINDLYTFDELFCDLRDFDLRDGINNYNQIIDKYTKKIEKEEKNFNAHVNCYNLTGKFEFDETEFLKLGNNNQVGSGSYDFYYYFAPHLVCCDISDIEEFYDSDLVGDLSIDQFVGYLYQDPENDIKSISKEIGIAIEKIGDLDEIELEAIGLVYDKIIISGDLGKALDMIEKRVLPKIYDALEAADSYNVEDMIDSDESVRNEIEKVEQELSATSSQEINYLDEDNTFEKKQSK